MFIKKTTTTEWIDGPGNLRTPIERARYRVRFQFGLRFALAMLSLIAVLIVVLPERSKVVHAWRESPEKIEKLLHGIGEWVGFLSP